MPQPGGSDAVRVAAIVNSFNRLELLQLGLPTLFRALEKCEVPAAVVVFEAGSSDGSPQWLAEFAARCPQIPLVVERAHAGGDTSFSAGVNAACRAAAQRFPGVEFFFLFETDNYLDNERPLIEALDFLQSGPRDACAAGFVLRKHDGPGPGFGCPFPRPLSFVAGPQLAQALGWDNPKLNWQSFKSGKWSYCDVVFTSPLLIRRSDWEAVGGLDAATFPFSDCDLDLAWRLRRKGRKMAVLQSDAVIHDNKSQASAWSETRVMHFHRARYQLLQRFYGPKIGALRPFLALRHAVECLAVVLLAPKIRHPRATLAKRARLLLRAFAGYR